MKNSFSNFSPMINTKIVQLWSCWLLVFVQNVHSNFNQTQLISLCNQTLHLSSSLSILFTPLSSSTCCNVTLRSSTNSSENLLINLNKTFSMVNSPLKIFSDQVESIEWSNYSSFNRTLMKSNVLRLPLIVNFCQTTFPSFEMFITTLSRGPCLSNQYRCLIPHENSWCIDEIFHCDGFHSCPNGFDETSCSKSVPRYVFPKMKRTIRGGIVTTIIVFGLLLIISSVSIAVVFVYLRRKRQRRRQFTYSLESTSDDWEPSGTGYHLFDNWPTTRRNAGNTIDNLILETNEHLPITTSNR